jgi:hypothetical protein
MKFKIALTLFVATLLCSCQKDIIVQDDAAISTHQVDESQYFTPSAAYLATLDAYGRKPESALRSADCYWTEIPAGSTNALAQAINSACEGGVIYLKSGLHTENIALTITKSVKIIGETGAILKVKTQLSLNDTTTGATATKPFLHVLNAPRTLIQDLDIQVVDTEGSGAVLFENSHESAVMRCKFTKFQFAISVEKSDRMVIMGNNIVGTNAWQTNPRVSAFGITIINGTSAYVADNQSNTHTFGIWACDKWGTCERNTTMGNYEGIILCNVPMVLKLPSGRITGSLTPGKLWKTRNNKSTDNFGVGIIVIDGANENIVENNELARNGEYDIELTTDTYRFGFLTPLAYNNTVNAGNYPNIRIKDCGRNNRITGGIRINTTTDPCN